MNVRNLVTLLTLLFLPAVAFAFGTDEAENARAVLISRLSTLVTLLGYLVGFVVLLTGLYKLTQITKDGVKNPYISPAIYVISGVLMMDIFHTLDVLTLTMFNFENFCQVIKDDAIAHNCMSDAMSGLTGDMKTRLEKLSSGNTVQAFLDQISVIVGIFQLIGLIYVLVGLYGLIQVANGSAQNGYAKPLVTIFAAALIVDIPHTAQMAINTLESIGINF